ncbi:MAG: response regulator [Alphaproteobacteria bacterium]
MLTQTVIGSQVGAENQAGMDRQAPADRRARDQDTRWFPARGRGLILAGAALGAGLVVGFVHLGLPLAGGDFLQLFANGHQTSVLVFAAQALAAALAVGRFTTTGNQAFLVMAAAFAGSAVTEALVRVAGVAIAAARPEWLGPNARLAAHFFLATSLLFMVLIMGSRFGGPLFRRWRLGLTPGRVVLAAAGLSAVLAAWAVADASDLVSAPVRDAAGRGLAAMSAIAMTAALVIHLVNGGWRHRDSDFWLALALVIWVAGSAVDFRLFPADQDGVRFALAQVVAQVATQVANGAGTLMVSVGLLIAIHHLFTQAARTADRIRGIFETAVDGIFTIDERGRIESLNRAAEAMFKVEACLAIGRPLADFVDLPDDTSLSSATAEPGHQGARDHGRAWRSDRSTFPAEIALSGFTIQGEPHRTVVVRDITERRTFEAMRRSRNQELQEFLDAMSTLSAKLSRDGLVETCNQKAVQASGLPLSFIRGRPIWAAPFFNGAPRCAVRLRRAVRAAARGIDADYEDVILIRGREPLDVRIVVRPVHDRGGEVKYIIAEATDVSRLAQVEQALRRARDSALDAARVKSEFLAMMSHELRTPLNGVLGIASLLLETRLDEEQREYVGLIEHSARGLLDIFNDILDFSKAEAGKLEIVEEDFDLIQLIDGVVDLVAHQARERDLDIGTLIPHDIVTALRGDAGRLRQVLLNLVSNAVKFTELGAISIEARIESKAADAVVVHFEVTDTGIGIAPEDQSRLFAGFSQVDTSSARRFGGTGLGLAVSKKLIELMGGTIGVESELGGGSRFWFSLPLRRQDHPTIAGKVAVAVPNLEGWRVLVVDDRELDQRIFQVQIQRLGAQVVAAASGPDGVAELKRAAGAGSPYDLAIVDHHMPGMDGFGFGECLAGDPALAGLPRLMVSSGPLRGDADRAMTLGYLRFLAKPIHRQRLFETLNEVLRHGKSAAATNTPQPEKPVVEAIANAPAGDAMRILIAEDNEVNQLLLLAFLKAGGYEADVAVNGREAVAAIAARPYALVLMDVQMPVMDGIEATAAIRALDSPAKDVPIIAATASNAPGDRDLFLASGMDDFLPKPIRRDSLLRMVEKWWPKGTAAKRVAAG